MDEESVFAEAIKRQSASSRAEYLARACAGNAELRAGVEELLREHDEVDSLLDAPIELVESPATEDPDLTELPRTRIGPYKLLQEIGRGGFGVVYMAEQTEPIRRKVALKIIKPGMDTRDVIARFDAERQAMAMMDHPNIAKILDAGSTDAGRPYFVMELVQGVPINQYCDTNNLSTQHRLELFMQVCRAVQHAHQKAVIHRDIKPNNIMVTLHDGRPVPKVIDFGVAKALNQPLTERTLFTRYGQMIGTPQYMSPEQAEMSGLDIDTRSDVYSLGVVLYELLTGRPPFSAETLREAGLDEIRRIIREQEPARPSLCVRTLDNEAATTVATHRSIAPQALSKLLIGSLDRVVMKSLEKDRTRRYETASELADDVNRFIHNEAVGVGPPSSAQLIRKLYQGHRKAFGVAATLLAAIVLGFALFLGLYVREEGLRRAAVAHATNAETQREIAEQATQEAKAQKKIAEDNEQRTREFLRQLIDLLTKFERDPATGESVTVPEMLDGLASGLEEQFRDFPDLAGPFHMALARSRIARGESSLTLIGEPAEHFALRARNVFAENTQQHAECLRYLGLLNRDMTTVQKAAKIEASLNGGVAKYQTLSVLGYLSYVADSQDETTDLQEETSEYLKLACDEFDERFPPRLFEEIPFLWMSIAQPEAGNTLEYRQLLARSRKVALSAFPQRNGMAWRERAKSMRFTGAQCLDFAELCVILSGIDTSSQWHNIYNSQGRLILAEKRLQELVAASERPVGGAAWNHCELGRVCYSVGDYSGAVPYLEKAIEVLEQAGVPENGIRELVNQHAYLNFELGLLLVHLKEEDRAKKCLRVASANYGEWLPHQMNSDAQWLYILISSLVLAGDPVDMKWLDDVPEDVLSASLRKPYRAIPYATQGLIDEAMGDAKSAVRGYEDYLLRSAGWGNAAFYPDLPLDRLLRLYVETESIDEAVKFLPRVIEATDKYLYRRHPVKGLARVRIAKFLIENHRETDRARSYLMTAREILKDQHNRSLTEIRHEPELAKLKDRPVVPQRLFDEIDDLLGSLRQ